MQRSARKAGAMTIAMVNEVDLPLATEAEELLPLMAGREQSVAATKSMIAGLVAGAALVAAWRGDADLMDRHRRPAGDPAGRERAAPFRHDRTARARRARLCARTRRDLCGRHRGGVEAQGDLRDSRRGFSAAEVMHGPAELARAGFPVIAFMPRDEARQGMEAALVRLADAGAKILRVEAGRRRRRRIRWPQKLRRRPG